MAPTRCSGPSVSEQLCELVDRSATGLLLVRETLGELTIIALTLGFEADQVAQSDTTIAANTVGHDLTSIKELVQVRAAHSETLGSLVRSKDRGTVDDGEFGTITNAATQAQQHVTQLGAGAGQCILFKRVELLNGDVRGFDGLHRAQPIYKCHR